MPPRKTAPTPPPPAPLEGAVVTADEFAALMTQSNPGNLRLSQLVPWDDNPRDHDPAQVAMLVKSIKAHGMVRPVMVQAGSNKIVAGHGTRLALLQLCPAGTDPAVPVVFARLTDEQAKAYAVADNRLSDLSTWNVPLLRGIMAELDTGAFDLECVGFTPEALSDLFGAPGPGSTLLPGADPDAAPPKPAPADIVTKPGELILLGTHRLLCGDSTSMADWETLMNGSKADLILTDPPYGVAYESSAAGLNNDGRASIKNDALDPEALEVFLKACFLCAVHHSAKHAAFYVFYPSRFHREFENALNHASLSVRAQIIWAKNAASFGFSQYKWKHEPVLMAMADDAPPPLIYVEAHETAFYAFKQKQSPLWEGDRSQTTVWSCARETGYVHPTQKPVELLKRPIVNSSKPRMLVVDPFGGSGSTLMTCEVLGRSCYSLELDAGFCDVIVKRWEDATGRKATRILPV